MSKVVIIGPAHPLREGGIVSFNHRLAIAFQQAGHDCEIWSFSLQYPSFLFPGTSQYSKEPAPKGIRIKSIINSINPINWVIVGKKIKSLRPDLIVVRFWLPLMGPSLGTILSIVKKNKHTRIVCLADNIIPHEKRPGDQLFTRYFLRQCHCFITMSDQVSQDLRHFEKHKPYRQVAHPLYDHFGVAVSQQEARTKLGLSASDNIILFFGFIRPYKGLDLLLEAMADERLASQNIKLLIAGEYYENAQPYLDLINRLQLNDRVISHTHFIADADVRYYLCAADVVVQPYKQATQSGVTPLAYHFEKPMIVTRVGGLADAVPHESAGLVCEPNGRAIAEAILRFYQSGADRFAEGIKAQRDKLSWSTLVHSIEELALLNTSHASNTR
jgi:glycosyltransferase involved in cell wall biosynthesis